MLKIRKGNPEDVETILRIFDSAKKYMRAKGNLSQWSDGYPSRSHVLEDIENGVNYVGETPEGEIVMTFTFIEGEDPTYLEIEGEWLNNEPYGTIHRIASDGTVSGVVKEACEFCFKKTENLRIDTHENNTPMRKALSDLDFIECGIIICRDGTPRIAFQKKNNCVP